MSETVTRVEQVGWLAMMAVLVAFAIPWFLWGADRVIAGLPIWVWWHIGWMAVAGVVFWVFTKRAWGIWIRDGNPEWGDQA
ncbi:DUF3311 domain-containing protein [Halovenus marina]|uniref:DUF3311 domain-containing protein n=1 Tax=Halovenus marina TaxID=3396621 RepID=UPI003F564091